MINKYTLFATGYAGFFSLLVFLILSGRIDNVLLYVGITFGISWFMSMIILGMAVMAGEYDQKMEEEWERRREVE